MPALVNVNGETVTEATLHVPNVGPWWADVVFELAPALFGSVTLEIGDLSLTGTILERESGTFTGRLRARIVGGGAGWGDLVNAKAYHSDGVASEGGGVRAQTVAEDLARTVNETIGTFVVSDERIGIDYVQQSGAASRALEEVINGTPWHVGYDGNTNVGVRDSTEVNPNDYQVLDYAPASKLATLVVDDLSKVAVGSIITDGLDNPETIYELEIKLTQDTIRVMAWVGGSSTGRGRLAALFRNIARRANDDKIIGPIRYRVQTMSGDRVELQIVEAQSGTPDILPISMSPGVAGAHSELAGGSIVLVDFIEGKRTLPIILAFSGKDAPGHIPTETVLSVSAKLKLGDDTATDAVGLAPSIDSQLNTINAALDAFALAIPVSGDGGAAIHTAFTGAWGSTPKPPSSVGATKVDAK